MSTNINYYNVNNILYWQGIRYLNNNFYILVGTTNENEGILYIGSVINYNSQNSYKVMYPSSILTSVYGPDYYSTGVYRLVGIYKILDHNNAFGFFFEGTLDNLNNPDNYKTVNGGGNYTYLHSIMGDILVGNYDDINKYGQGGLPFGPVSAFLYIISIGKKIEITYPGSTSNTVYGIWYNGGTSYTLCGGYSNDYVQITEIYTKTGPIPIGNAYIVNYDSLTGIFTNWTSINFTTNLDLLTHFQGISKNSSNEYQLCADSVNRGSIFNVGSWLNAKIDLIGNFYITNINNIKYPLPLTSTSVNSVSGNVTVGTYFDANQNSIAFQSILE